KCDGPRAVAWRCGEGPRGLLPSRLESARARSSAKARDLLIKTTQREHSSSACGFSPTEPLTEISVELCPNGNSLWRPESRFSDTVTCRSRKSQSGADSPQWRRGQKVALPARFFFGLAGDGPSGTVSRSTRPIPQRIAALRPPTRARPPILQHTL